MNTHEVFRTIRNAALTIPLALTVASCQPRPEGFQTPQPLPMPTPTPELIPSPDAQSTDVFAPLDTNIYATGEANYIQGRDNNFVEDGDYTNEMFDTLRLSVAQFQFSKTGNTTRGLCSGVIVKITEDRVIFATAKHCITPGDFDTISYWRPHVDTQPYVTSSFYYVTAADRDFSLIAIKKPIDLPETYLAVPMRDDFAPPQGTKILCMGYPKILTYQDFNVDGMLFSAINPITPGAFQDHVIVTKGIGVSGGMSGGLGGIVDQGKIHALGVISASGLDTQNNPYTFITLSHTQALLPSVLHINLER